jgi:hypothetical protein
MEKDAYARGLRFGGKQRKEIYKMDEGLPNIENREIIWTPSYYKNGLRLLFSFSSYVSFFLYLFLLFIPAMCRA